MTKKIATLATAPTLIFFSVSPVLADLVDYYPPAKAVGGRNITISTLVNPLINNVPLIFSLLAFLMILLAGLKYVTSGGNPKATQQAQTMLTYAVVGLVITAAAYLITKIAFTMVNLGDLF